MELRFNRNQSTDIKGTDKYFILNVFEMIFHCPIHGYCEMNAMIVNVARRFNQRRLRTDIKRRTVSCTWLQYHIKTVNVDLETGSMSV
jgi:hypothetical protein